MRQVVGVGQWWGKHGSAGTGQHGVELSQSVTEQAKHLRLVPFCIIRPCSPVFLKSGAWGVVRKQMLKLVRIPQLQKLQQQKCQNHGKTVRLLLPCRLAICLRFYKMSTVLNTVSSCLNAQFWTACIPLFGLNVIFTFVVTQCESYLGIMRILIFILIWLEMFCAYMCEDTVIYSENSQPCFSHQDTVDMNNPDY